MTNKPLIILFCTFVLSIPGRSLADLYLPSKVSSEGMGLSIGKVHHRVGTKPVSGIIHIDDMVLSLAKDDSYIVTTRISEVGQGESVELFRYNTNGEVIWMRDLDSYGRVTIKGVRILDDETIVLLGAVKTKKQEENAFILRLDSCGRELWSTQWGGEYNDIAVDVVEGKDETLTILGSTDNDYKSALFFDAQNETGDDIFLAKIDRQGIIIDTKIYAELGDATPLELARMPENSYLVLATQDDDEVDVSYTVVQRVDENFDTMWRYNADETDLVDSDGFSIDKNGAVYISGQYEDGEEFYAAFLLKLSSAGKLAWRKKLEERDSEGLALTEYGLVFFTSGNGVLNGRVYSDTGTVLGVTHFVFDPYVVTSADIHSFGSNTGGIKVLYTLADSFSMAAVINLDVSSTESTEEK